MADARKPTDAHEQARDLTEQALDDMVQGVDAAAHEKVERAKQLDPSAPREVLEELEEDAADRGETAKPR